MGKGVGFGKLPEWRGWKPCEMCVIITQSQIRKGAFSMSDFRWQIKNDLALIQRDLGIRSDLSMTNYKKGLKDDGFIFQALHSVDSLAYYDVGCLRASSLKVLILYSIITLSSFSFLIFL